ncbi:hypothetical protein [Bacillus sp. Brlt_9]|uniref:hypothetical protein n=1 Tax=Bacillus sp. Brlt_9 TaxID=3110916 RepID=UPI003F7C7EB3
MSIDNDEQLNNEVSEQDEFDKFRKLFEQYMDFYIEHKKASFKLDYIKEQFKMHYEKQEDKTLKVDGVITRVKRKKEYVTDEGIYEYLEDHGYLPLVVTVNKSIENRFNLEKAKIDYKQSVRLYTGGKSIVDRFEVTSKLDYILDYSLEQLSESFKRSYTDEKLKKARLDEAKERLMDGMPFSSCTTEYGTLKKTSSYDYDLDVVFDGISGKKEILIRKLEDSFEIKLFPDDQVNTVPMNHCFGEISLADLYENNLLEPESVFIKKRELKKHLKDGFVFNQFEVPVDPYEFYRKCPISKTKINELIQEGIIDEKEIEKFIEVTEETFHTEVISEGSMEQQATLNQQKFRDRSENIRRRHDDNYVETHNPYTAPNPYIELGNFSF